MAIQSGWVGSSAVSVTGQRWMSAARTTVGLPKAGYMSELIGKPDKPKIYGTFGYISFNSAYQGNTQNWGVGNESLWNSTPAFGKFDGTFEGDVIGEMYTVTNNQPASCIWLPNASVAADKKVIWFFGQNKEMSITFTPSYSGGTFFGFYGTDPLGMKKVCDHFGLNVKVPMSYQIV